MTNHQYLAALRKLKLVPHGNKTAKLLDCSKRQLARFASGERPIPDLIATVLELKLQALVADKLQSELETR